MRQKLKLKWGLIIFYVLLIASNLIAQTEGVLQYNWTDTSSIVARQSGARYNEVWGFKINGIEYGVIGSTMGTHFINIAQPDSAFQQGFVPGKSSGRTIVHRDFHDYEGYLYGVCDQGRASLQVIDIRHLPDSVTLVHQDSVNIMRSHNLFVDSVAGKLYTCGVRLPDGGGRMPIQVWSLEDPALPMLLNNVSEIDGVPIEYVHDMYARGDTVYMNAGNQGLFVASFSDPLNPVLLGRLAMYEDAGYNHSGWLNERGDRYYMADETWGMDIKILDVSDLSRINVLQLIEAESDPVASIPHNLIVKDDMLYVSYYFDGLQVFDVSGDTSTCRTHSYPTSDFEPEENRFRGAWGVYPFLPSGLILVSDMSKGLFIIELPELEEPDTLFADGTPLCEPVTSSQNEDANYEDIFLAYTGQRGEYLITSSNEHSGNLTVIDAFGRVILQDAIHSKETYPLSISHLSDGIYFLHYQGNKGKISFKLTLF